MNPGFDDSKIQKAGANGFWATGMLCYKTSLIAYCMKILNTVQFHTHKKHRQQKMLVAQEQIPLSRLIKCKLN